jgi:hypothetical protein
MTASRGWSLHAELNVVEQAIRAAGSLLATVENQPGDETYARDVARNTEAVLSLVTLRLRELGRMLRGEVPTDSLRTPHNAVDEDEHDDHDVIFTPRASSTTKNR